MSNEFISGFENNPLLCKGCVKSDVCREEKERMTHLHMEIIRKLDCVMFPNYANLSLNCKFYYPDLTKCLCD